MSRATAIPMIPRLAKVEVEQKGVMHRTCHVTDMYAFSQGEARSAFWYTARCPCPPARKRLCGSVYRCSGCGLCSLAGRALAAAGLGRSRAQVILTGHGSAGAVTGIEVSPFQLHGVLSSRLFRTCKDHAQRSAIEMRGCHGPQADSRAAAVPSPACWPRGVPGGASVSEPEQAGNQPCFCDSLAVIGGRDRQSTCPRDRVQAVLRRHGKRRVE
jgi:hypothetical protein